MSFLPSFGGHIACTDRVLALFLTDVWMPGSRSKNNNNGGDNGHLGSLKLEMGCVKTFWPRWAQHFLPFLKDILKCSYSFLYNGSFAAWWPHSWSCWLGWADLGSTSGFLLCRAGSGAGWSLPSLFLADFWLPPSPRACNNSQDKMEACRRWRFWRYFGDFLLVSDFFAGRVSSQDTITWEQGWWTLSGTWKS